MLMLGGRQLDHTFILCSNLILRAIHSTIQPISFGTRVHWHCVWKHNIYIYIHFYFLVQQTKARPFHWPIDIIVFNCNVSINVFSFCCWCAILLAIDLIRFADLFHWLTPTHIDCFFSFLFHVSVVDGHRIFSSIQRLSSRTPSANVITSSLWSM